MIDLMQAIEKIVVNNNDHDDFMQISLELRAQAIKNLTKDWFEKYLDQEQLISLCDSAYNIAATEIEMLDVPKEPEKELTDEEWEKVSPSATPISHIKLNKLYMDYSSACDADVIEKKMEDDFLTDLTQHFSKVVHDELSEEANLQNTLGSYYQVVEALEKSFDKLFEKLAYYQVVMVSEAAALVQTTLLEFYTQQQQQLGILIKEYNELDKDGLFSRLAVILESTELSHDKKLFDFQCQFKDFHREINGSKDLNTMRFLQRYAEIVPSVEPYEKQLKQLEQGEQLGLAIEQYQAQLSKTIEEELVSIALADIVLQYDPSDIYYGRETEPRFNTNGTHQEPILSTVKDLLDCKEKDNRRFKYLISQNANLELTVNKYDELSKLADTLKSTKLSPGEKLNKFKSQFRRSRSIIEKQNDSAGITFLKVVASVLSLGLAVAFGIWRPAGQLVNDRLDEIINNPRNNSLS